MKEINAEKDELLLVLDENGNSTGRFEQRSVVHENLLWHREVSCIVLNKYGQILLQKRNKNKKSYPSKWALCAGHVVNDEEPKDAVVKELSEELILPFNSRNVFSLLVGEIKNEREDNKCFVTCFWTLFEFPINQLSFQESEIEGLAWFTLDEFKRLVEREEDIFKNNDYYKSIIVALEELLKDKKYLKKQFEK